MIRKYSELRKLKTLEERYEYLKLSGNVGESTFGFDRYLNQMFYRSKEWKKIRNDIIVRDNGNDLGVEGFELNSGIIIHHMNPVTVSDLKVFNEDILNPEYLICTSRTTHNAIHYGDKSLLMILPKERKPGDTCPWK